MSEVLFQSLPYKKALEQVKFRIDEASKANLQIFKQAWWKEHLRLGAIPHTMSTFETVIGKMHLPIMASTINDKSAEPLRMNQGFDKVRQGMFTHAHGYKMDADEIREIYLMIKGATSDEGKIVGYITDKLFNHVEKAIEGVDARISYMLQYILSNGGTYTFTKDNDPQSPFVGQTISFGMPDGNKGVQGSGNTWTTANVKIIDPIKDIDDVLKKSKVQLKYVLLDRASLNFMMSTDAMKNYVNSSLYPNLPLTLSRVNDWMASNGYPILKVVDSEFAIQDGDALKSVSGWKAGQLAFIPDQYIGTLETRLSDAEMEMKSPGVDYTYYNRVEVRRYELGEKENSTFCQITKANLTAAPSISSIANIYTLDTTK